MHVNNSVTIKTVGWVSLCDGVKLEESEGYNYFFVVFCVLESDSISSCWLMSNKSQFVGHL